MLKRLVKNLFKCSHKNALINSNEGFCPDCGQYLRKTYYVVRCNDCGIKRFAKKKFNEITPSEKFCTCCGSENFIVEKYQKLNFVDINYAIEVKEEIENKGAINELEIWIDENKKQDKKNPEPKPLIGEVKYLGTI